MNKSKPRPSRVSHSSTICLSFVIVPKSSGRPSTQSRGHDPSWAVLCCPFRAVQSPYNWNITAWPCPWPAIDPMTAVSERQTNHDTASVGTDIRFQNGINGCHAQAMLLGLSQQYPVKGISVQRRQLQCLGQLGVGREVPQKHMGVEQYFHRPSKSLKTSSVSGASKSSGTVNSPRQSPIGRFFTAPPPFTGPSSATGFPSRTTTKRSPAATRSSKARESRCHSCMVMVVMMGSYQKPVLAEIETRRFAPL